VITRIGVDKNDSMTTTHSAQPRQSQKQTGKIRRKTIETVTMETKTSAQHTASDPAIRHGEPTFRARTHPGRGRAGAG